MNTLKLIEKLRDKPAGAPVVPVYSFDTLYQYFEILKKLNIPCGLQFSLDSVNKYDELVQMLRLAAELRAKYETFTFFVYDAGNDIDSAMDMTTEEVEIIRYDGTHEEDFEYIRTATELSEKVHKDGDRQLLEIDLGKWLDAELDGPFHDIFAITEAVEKIQPDILGFQFVNVYKDFEFRGTKQLDKDFLKDLYSKVSLPVSFRGIEILPQDFIRQAQQLDLFLEYGVGIKPEALRNTLETGGALVYLGRDSELAARLAKRKFTLDPDAIQVQHLLDKTGEEIEILLTTAGEILKVQHLE
jgi:fructose/tagatose bisphosphate aldolase